MAEKLEEMAEIISKLNEELAALKQQVRNNENDISDIDRTMQAAVCSRRYCDRSINVLATLNCRPNTLE